MILAYDIERLSVALDRVEESARELERRHKIPDWLSHRLAHIRAEAHSLRVEIEKTKGSCNG